MRHLIITCGLRSDTGDTKSDMAIFKTHVFGVLCKDRGIKKCPLYYE